MSKLRTSSAAFTSACGGRLWRGSGTSSTSRPARRWARDQIPGKRFSYQVFRKFIWILEDSSFRIQNTYKSLKLSSCSCEQEEHIFSNRLSVATLHSECGTIVQISIILLQLREQMIGRAWNKGPHKDSALRHYANQPACPFWPLRWGPTFMSTYRGVNVYLA